MILFFLFFSLIISPSYAAQQARQPRGKCGDLFITLLNPIYNNKPVLGFIKRKHLFQVATLAVIVRAFCIKNELWIGIGIYMALWMWYYCNYKWWEAEEELNRLKELASVQGLGSIGAQLNLN